MLEGSRVKLIFGLTAPRKDRPLCRRGTRTISTFRAQQVGARRWGTNLSFADARGYPMQARNVDQTPCDFRHMQNDWPTSTFSFMRTRPKFLFRETRQRLLPLVLLGCGGSVGTETATASEVFQVNTTADASGGGYTYISTGGQASIFPDAEPTAWIEKVAPLFLARARVQSDLRAPSHSVMVRPTSPPTATRGSSANSSIQLSFPEAAKASRPYDRRGLNRGAAEGRRAHRRGGRKGGSPSSRSLCVAGATRGRCSAGSACGATLTGCFASRGPQASTVSFPGLRAFL